LRAKPRRRKSGDHKTIAGGGNFLLADVTALVNLVYSQDVSIASLAEVIFDFGNILIPESAERRRCRRVCRRFGR
jgi:hypothetical protein